MSNYEISAKWLDGYSCITFDLSRPWGGFFCIKADLTKKFVNNYFPKIDIDISAPISPKLLIINPGARLSWQYHLRRKEIWSVLEGPVGVTRSFDNDQSEIIIYQTGDIIFIEKEERHRLIGLDKHAIVAELWCHTDLENLSTEDDIIRLADDYRNIN